MGKDDRIISKTVTENFRRKTSKTQKDDNIKTS
jgi:hypothetical protein